MTPTTDDDAGLMLRLAAGEDLALNELMRRWSERVAAFLTRMAGDHSTALDLTQETFVRLYQSRHRYRPTAAFSTYLFHIAANLARSHARWKSRHPTISLSGEGEGDGPAHPEALDRAPRPDEQAHLRERLASLDTALAALPDTWREALLLSVLEGMSHVEIAATLGRSRKAVELAIYRARQTLRAAAPD